MRILKPSGTSSVLSKQLGRSYIGIDKEQYYCEMEKEQLIDLIDKKVGKI